MSLLSLKNISKRYLSDRGEWTEIVRISSFELNPGEQVLLQGESGSGKSTLLNMIAGIVTADTGEISLDGVDMRSLRESARDEHRARSLGYVFRISICWTRIRVSKMWSWEWLLEGRPMLSSLGSYLNGLA